MLDFAITAFVSILFLVDRPGIIPAYLALTGHYEPAKRRKTALVASTAATLTMIGFAAVGTHLLRYLGLTLPAFQIAGGAILFLVALDMIRAQRSTQEDPEEMKEGAASADVAIAPLAIPMLENNCWRIARVAVGIFMSSPRQTASRCPNPDFGTDTGHGRCERVVAHFKNDRRYIAEGERIAPWLVAGQPECTDHVATLSGAGEGTHERSVAFGVEKEGVVAQPREGLKTAAGCNDLLNRAGERAAGTWHVLQLHAANAFWVFTKSDQYFDVRDVIEYTRGVSAIHVQGVKDLGIAIERAVNPGPRRRSPAERDRGYRLIRRFGRRKDKYIGEIGSRIGIGPRRLGVIS